MRRYLAVFLMMCVGCGKHEKPAAPTTPLTKYVLLYYVKSAAKYDKWGLVDIQTGSPMINEHDGGEIDMYLDPSMVNTLTPGDMVTVTVEFGGSK